MSVRLHPSAAKCCVNSRSLNVPCLILVVEDGFPAFGDLRGRRSRRRCEVCHQVVTRCFEIDDCGSSESKEGKTKEKKRRGR